MTALALVLAQVMFASLAAIGIVPVAVPAFATADLHMVTPHVWWLVLYLVLFPTIGAYFLNM